MRRARAASPMVSEGMFDQVACRPGLRCLGWSDMALLIDVVDPLQRDGGNAAVSHNATYLRGTGTRPW